MIKRYLKLMKIYLIYNLRLKANWVYQNQLKKEVDHLKNNN